LALSLVKYAVEREEDVFNWCHPKEANSNNRDQEGEAWVSTTPQSVSRWSVSSSYYTRYAVTLSGATFAVTAHEQVPEWVSSAPSPSMSVAELKRRCIEELKEVERLIDERRCEGLGVKVSRIIEAVKKLGLVELQGRVAGVVSKLMEALPFKLVELREGEIKRIDEDLLAERKGGKVILYAITE